MNRKKAFSLMLCVTGLTAMVALDVLAGVATPATIIVMPARRRVVELASQIARIKDVGLVSYSTLSTLAAPLIHIWNGAEWIPISMDAYVAGTFMSGAPKHLIVLGDSAMVPERMSTDPTWCHAVQRIATLGTATLLNDLDKTLKFSSRQWKWLAEENGLALTDKNSDRRRYGRWGPPGSEADAANPTTMDAVQMPPAPVLPEAKDESKPVPTPPAFTVDKPAEPVIAPPLTPVDEPPVDPAPMDK